MVVSGQELHYDVCCKVTEEAHGHKCSVKQSIASSESARVCKGRLSPDEACACARPGFERDLSSSGAKPG